MRQTLVLVLLCIGLVTCDLSPYKPRGWRPSGQHFNPTSDRLSARYGPPDVMVQTPISTTTTTTTTTMRPTTIPRTTTPRSREPTTSSNIPEEDFIPNPAVAIANSFAFNRPVYIYNTFPFYPDHVLLK